MDWPVTSEPSRAKARPLRPRRSCFGPAAAAPASSLTERTGPTAMGLRSEELHGWSRRVLPTGPIGLLRRPFIAIAGPCGTAGVIYAAKVDEKRAAFRLPGS